MSKLILAEKVNMTQMFDESGNVVPVTIVKAGPVKVVQVKKSGGADGYDAIQVGFGKKKSTTKPLKGHMKDLDVFRYLKEFRVEKDEEYEVGQVLNVSQFESGDYVDVSGVMKGRGFTGVMKRYGFKGMPASHGHEKQRIPGSIGGMFPQHVLKGKKMAGRMGGKNVTVKNLEVVEIDADKNLMAVKGAVPGASGDLLQIALSKNKTNSKSKKE